jgi:hypothetical protein
VSGLPCIDGEHAADCPNARRAPSVVDAGPWQGMGRGEWVSRLSPWPTPWIESDYHGGAPHPDIAPLVETAREMRDEQERRRREPAR